jgi:hypothetical protein
MVGWFVSVFPAVGEKLIKFLAVRYKDIFVSEDNVLSGIDFMDE